MKFSIVFPCVNDQVEAVETARSARETAPDAEILVIDDCSAATLTFPPELNIRVHRNRHRIGAGASRHVGMQIATGSHVLMLDSHCRLEAGWLEKFNFFFGVGNDAGNPHNTVYCGICHGFTPKIPPFVRPSGIYYGANLQFIGHDPNQASRIQVLEGVWAGQRPDNTEISCPMGACAIVPRQRYLELGGWQHLRMWGCEEQMLALKFWLSGGEVRLFHGLKSWHRFRDGEKMPFRLETWAPIYNKLFTIHTMFPDDLAAHMISRLPKGADLNKAVETIRRDWGLVEAERAHNASLFVHDALWLCEKFNVELL